MFKVDTVNKAVLAAGLFILPFSFASYYITFQNNPSHLFWDFNVYIRAISEFNRGIDPYTNMHHLIFVYPPFFLHMLSPIEDSLEHTLFLFMMASTLLLFKKNLRPLLIGFIFCAGLLHVHVVRALLSGNVTTFLHIAIIFTWTKFDQNRALFYTTLLASSALKPYYLAYLLLPLIKEWPSKKNWKFAGLTVAACAATFGFQYIYLTDETLAFLSALSTQTGALDASNSNNDLGEGLYAIFTHKFDNKITALFLHISIISCLIAFNIRLLQKITSEESRTIIHLWLPIMIACLANPRLKVYDSAIITASAAAIIITLSRYVSSRVPIAILLVFCSLKWLPNTRPFEEYRQSIDNTFFFEPYIFVISSVYLLIKYYFQAEFNPNTSLRPV